MVTKSLWTLCVFRHSARVNIRKLDCLIVAATGEDETILLPKPIGDRTLQ